MMNVVLDRRNRAARERTWYERFDEKTMTAVLLREDNEGFESEVSVPCRFAVCDLCDGRGSHVNPSIDAHGITASEWEEDWDDESREDYFSGRYDVPCYACDGLRVVPVPDEDHMTGELKEAVKEMYERQAEEARESYEDAYVRRMERGGY